MAPQNDSKKRLALTIIDYLQTSLKDGTLTPEDADSIEIASNCIAECFHVDPTDETAMKDALGGQNLLSIYGVFEKMKGKGGPAPTAASASSSSTTASPAPPGAPTEESEKLKGLGNVAMQKKDYQAAADNYTKALELCPLNPIYLSNRAAAFSAMQKHELAKNDAELATATDPKYTKAWSRLGLARFALGDAKGAMEAYKQGIDAEGNGGSDAMKKGYETAKRKVEEEGADGDESDDDAAPATRGAGAGAGGMPDLGSLASMLGGGGGGGAGGMPDLGALLNNPMMRNMAQSLMSNPEALNSMMSGLGRGGGGGGGTGGGGMPDISAMMQDPAIAEMARNFMSGMGGQGGAGRGAGGNQ
ncbi:small glutamine-rich tetratricopeptide repeat-containing protein [Zymoseptoria brevis]|uniref:Small glutamine-rich tetratricopeptide repeat-containing protein n=1 Tax=Zymoseptoria brevis TaxID=1047168 RepID=A0A0F4GBI3_9PEZI|nr:small glutamine-rich tetratricopeptide repeat-containing protein [Zymoseptoria brevis]